MLALSLGFFVLGAVIASFVGVLAVRLHTGQSFILGRSQCDSCATPLKARQLVPVLSYVFSGGRANCCGARLSLFAPFSEVLLGALFVLSYQRLGLSYALLCMCVALTAMLGLVLYDYAHQILPPVPLCVFIAASATTSFFLSGSLTEYMYTVLSALALGACLLLIHVLSRGRAMGFADAPFVVGCALLVGPAAFAGFIFSFWIGAIIGIIILVRRPAGSRMGIEVPFAPFLAAGFLLAYFTQWNPFIFGALPPY